ncbi:sugar kinase [Benzoatithermus flavus]|uniref:Sugar kinase n=1 Tax=Benzoatithermus flavus TaxID=3108223 RepID=A0ABU8XRX8_9PROT
MAQIVTIGEILVEIMATRIGQSFTEPGLFMGPYPSGAPAIFIDQAGRMGAGAAIAACVGDDEFATLNIERLRRSGVDTRFVRRVAGAATGSAFVTYRADGSRDFVFNIAHSAAGLLDATDLAPDLFAGCRFFHVMGSSLINPGLAQAARCGVELARAAGARISFDPNIRKELLKLPEVEATIRAILGQTDILLPSDADLEYLCPGQDADTAARSLLAAGRECLLLKRGALGSVYYDREQRIGTPAFLSEEVDPTGAGDCFGGTFVASLALGIPLPRALELANAAGALAVRKKGPMEGNATLAELEAFLATDPPRRQEVP